MEHIAAVVKLVSIQPCGRRHFLIKTTNYHIFSAGNRKYKFLLAASRTLNFGLGRRPQILYMTPF